MALTSQMQTLRIDYDPALVPAGGAEVTRACASPVSGEGRMTAEPAGRGFHEKVMRVTGLITGAFASPSLPARGRARSPPRVSRAFARRSLTANRRFLAHAPLAHPSSSPPPPFTPP
jgi:hypothetical protein